MAGIVFFCALMWWATEGRKPAPGSKPKPSAEYQRRLAEKRKNYRLNSADAEAVARKIVKDHLKAPAGANFISTTVLESDGYQYLVQAIVDAQNSFGAMTRCTYLVVYRLDPSSPRDYVYKQGIAVQEVSNPPTSAEIAAAKALNGW